MRPSAALLCLLAVVIASAAAGREATVRKVLTRACDVSHFAQAAEIGRGLPGFLGLRGRARAIDVTGWRVELLFDDATLAVSRLVRRGTLGRIYLEWRRGDGHAELAVTADKTCRIHDARRLRRDSRGEPQHIEFLDETLHPSGKREPLNPAVPTGSDPGGVSVGLIDTGVNYLLPELSQRLARRPDGALMGYDYWDLDRRPFDADPVHSLLFPARHGTRIASLLAREAPVARLVPYRYPRPDMGRMAALIDSASQVGVRLINVSLASTDRERWHAYETAARRHGDILFITAAGNRGRNIDRRPMYPAALDLENQITVTAATQAGRIAGEANWGPQLVHVMTPAEDLRTLGFDGAEHRVTGSSFAAARVSALAACLLAERPGLTARELKQAILARTAAGPESHRVAYGLLPIPPGAPHGACAAKIGSGGGT